MRRIPSRIVFVGHAILLGAGVTGGGCATTHRFTVDTVRSDAAAAALHSYVVVDARPLMETASLAFGATADLVKTALSSKGLFEAPAGIAADMLVEVDCGVDATGRRIETIVWEKKGEHEEPVTVATTVYEKFLRITARAAPATADARPRELWSVYVTNEDESVELAPYVPLLVSAAMDALTGHAAGPRDLVLHRGDERVAFVARGM